MKQNKSFKIISLYFILPFFFSSGDAYAYKENDFWKLLNTKKCVKCDLSKADLQNSDLRVSDLSHANLHKADLTDVNLSGANLSGANLSDSWVSNGNLSNRSS